MKLIVNGQNCDVAPAPLSEILLNLGYEADYIATALNGEFIPKKDRKAIRPNDGDQLEILSPRQGG